jgi:hypothetical protein
MSEWNKVEDGLPQDGEYIVGRNPERQEWEECFDSREPIGRMVEWKYAKDSSGE